MYFELMCVLSVRVSVDERRTKRERKKQFGYCLYVSVHGRVFMGSIRK